ncbi:MAG: hypothetical protein ACM3RX_01845 [Methanococcaceae archaeon]
MKRFFGKLLLLPFLVLLPFLSSCTKDSSDNPADPSNWNTTDKVAYVYFKSPAGIYYWKDGNSTLVVPTNGKMFGGLRLSPDGKWIMYANIVNHENIMEVVKINGDSLHTVFSGRAFPYEYHAEWAPDSRHIMIGDTSTILVTSFPGDVTESYATGSPGNYPHNYTWNSKGDKIYFTSPYQLNYPWYQGIYSIDLNAKQVDTVKKTQFLSLSSFSCSANNGSLAFTSYVEKPGSSNPDVDIFVLNLMDKTITQLTTSEGQDFASAWSPANPDLLAYFGYEDKTVTPRLLFVYNNRTKSKKALTSGTQFPSENLVWSEDGNRILFFDDNSNKWSYIDVSSGNITPINISCTGIDW